MIVKINPDSIEKYSKGIIEKWNFVLNEKIIARAYFDKNDDFYASFMEESYTKVGKTEKEVINFLIKLIEKRKKEYDTMHLYFKGMNND